MFKGRTVLAVVPARGGSKGVKLKNIHPLSGVPLISHTGMLIRELGYIDRAVVSTDHPAIAEVAQESGLVAPFFRPEELSGDLISDFQVLHHALTEMERLERTCYDVVVMLQPTSPLRKPAHVTAVIDKLIDEGWDAVWTVSPTDLKYHPLKQLQLSGDGAMEFFDPQGGAIVARQQLKRVYHRNGAAYAYTRGCLVEQCTVKGKRTAGLVIDEPMISIDTLEDFERVEKLMSRQGGIS
jgi:CMP-N,N'-diacetyllegionaminic acid synthase